MIKDPHFLSLPSRIRLLVALGLFFIQLQVSRAQDITHVRASQQGKEVVISYDISGASPADTYSVQLFLGTENGWQGPLKAVNGHVGPNVAGGCCKKIVWMAMNEYQAFSGNYRFKVVAEPTLKSKGTIVSQIPNPIEPEMVFVQGGTFLMGSRKDDPNAAEDEKPLHEVQVSSFYMGKYEVTFSEFKAFVTETGFQTDAEKEGSSYVWVGENVEKKSGINWRHDSNGKPRDATEKRHPVIHVSWNDAQAYIKWLNDKTGKNYRLPTESEWEFAAKGGLSKPTMPKGSDLSQSEWEQIAKGGLKKNGYMYSGSNRLSRVGWYHENSGGRTHKVGELEGNELGIFDMSGNVWEWCQDWYNYSYYSNRPDLDINPNGPKDGEIRVIRGGGFLQGPLSCRVSSRFGLDPNLSYWDIGVFVGLRLVISDR
jgi:formylglycine-generating enzyme required for sulfatase activity